VTADPGVDDQSRACPLAADPYPLAASPRPTRAHQRPTPRPHPEVPALSS